MAKKKGRSSTSRNGLRVEVWVALISGLVTVTVALFSFPPFQRLFDPSSTTPTVITEPTLTITPTFTDTLTGEPSFTPVFTPIFTATLTTTPSIETAAATIQADPTLSTGMHVRLVANQTRGKVPLKVRLNTKDSFFRDPSGAEFPCGACDYTWQVRQGSNVLFAPQHGQFTFEYTFRERGTYFVTVVICRSKSNDCGSTGTQIVAE